MQPVLVVTLDVTLVVTLDVTLVVTLVEVINGRKVLLHHLNPLLFHQE